MLASLIRFSLSQRLFILLATLLVAALGILVLPPLARAEDTGYRLPPPALQKIVDAPRAPRLVASPRRDLAALLRSQPLPAIAFVAQPQHWRVLLALARPRSSRILRVFITAPCWSPPPACAVPAPAAVRRSYLHPARRT